MCEGETGGVRVVIPLYGFVVVATGGGMVDDLEVVLVVIGPVIDGMGSKNASTQ